MASSTENFAQPWQQWHTVKAVLMMFATAIEGAVTSAKGGNAFNGGYMAYRGPTEPCNLNQRSKTWLNYVRIG